MEGESIATRTNGAWPAYTAGGGQPGRDGGGTLVTATTDVTNDDWENIFGPNGRDVRFDNQRYKRDGRLHLPSVLEGVNHYLTDRIDGLITDATNSPFTTVILPYQYLNNPDAKFTWNRYSFDEGLANRVPYESAARTLAQTRRSYEGYTIRQGLAITMEHNFMMSPAGRENFFNKWWQVVGSIQKTNDLDVHIALLSAPTYALEIKNKYYSRTKTPNQVIREHVDMFGFMQKNVNALDILIEEAKITLQTWGAKPPTFMLCNSKLTMQLTMTPEKTNFITQGYDGLRRLKQGPMLDSYRGLSVIHSRQYSLETGAPPRDLLRRRVRVAEYYRIPWQQCMDGNRESVMLDLYDEAKDTFFTVSWRELLQHAALDEADRIKFDDIGNQPEADDETFQVAALCSVRNNNNNAQDRLSVVRAPGQYVANQPAINQAAPVVIRNALAQRFTVNQNNTSGAGLLLVTNATANRVSGRVQIPQDPDRGTEHRTFYSGSGWFSVCAPQGQATNPIEFLPYIQTLALADGVFIQNQGDVNRKKASFRRLMFGLVDFQAGGALEYAGPHIDMGMRPNLHIGRMVFSDLRPDTMRFKHVAAHILAQTVVTRPLAERLMQPLEENRDMEQRILELFCASENTAQALVMANADGYYNIHRSALVYMAAAVLHPDLEVRNHCRGRLEAELGIDLTKIGEHLATWIKVFLNSMPIPQYGSQSPLFDAYEQGIVLAETFYRDARSPPADRDAIPPMYLGEYVERDAVQAAIDAAQATNPANIDAAYRAMYNDRWRDNGDNDLAMNRDVNERTFSKRQSVVFPNGKDRVEPNDVLAVVRTATSEDALIAFVTIMCKRFFTCRQELFVELDGDRSRANGELGGNRPPNFLNLPGTSRRALTSNEYPSIAYGTTEQINPAEQWEVVVIRPNIEHNMLGAVLGRGGIDDLGATFWGQTELSCYDDSMHGVWGMSYKYHERAMVTNEKNLIRLWDVAYDGYNGGKDDTFVSWTEESGHRSYNTLKSESANTTMPYTGPSIMVMAFPINNKDRIWERNWPSPIVFHESSPGKPLMQEPNYVLDPDNVERVFDERMRVFGQLYNKDSADPVRNRRYERYYAKMPRFTYQHTTKKSAGQAVAENESTGNSLAFQGTYRVWKEPGDGGGAGGTIIMDVKGSGHHGVDYVGVSSVRGGKGYKITGEGLQAVRQV